MRSIQFIKFEDWSIRAQVLIGPLLLFCITLLILIAAAYSTEQMQRSDALMDETLEILSGATTLTRQIADMEAAVRGFALAGDEQFLAPYHAAQAAMPETYAALYANMVSRREQTARLNHLEGLIEEWRARVAEVEIELVRQGYDPVPLVRSGLGRMRMDEIRADLAAIEAAERERLDIQTQEHNVGIRFLTNLYKVATVLAFGALALALWMGQRISAPIIGLGEAANRIARGDCNVILPHANVGNELGRTRHAFNLMIEALAEAQSALRAQSRRLAQHARAADHARSQTEAILDTVTEAILVVAPNQRIVAANRSVTGLFGLNPKDVMAQSPGELHRTRARVFADIDQVDAYIAEALAHPDTQNKIIVHQKWPEPRELELFTAPVIDESGAYQGRVFVFRDITKEREADRMKTEFVSMVSHELRTPLTSIKGFVDLLVAGDAGPLTEDQIEFLDVVKNNADRLVAMVNDLLDISRLEAGRVELRRTSIAVDALLRSLLVSLRPRIDAKQHRIVQQFAPDLVPVYGDAERITQVFINLISNAIKYTPNGGTITLAARSEGEFVRVDITDTGIGLSEADQAKLFTRFFRVKNRNIQDAGGTGLGLSITKSLVEMHGGSIQVESSPGAGATFSVNLPAAAVPMPTQTQTQYPGGLILVVEDEPDIAELIRVYLTRVGYEVDIVHDAATALASVRRRTPDLILLDIVLPGVDGKTLLGWLKSDETIAAIPVVLLSIMPDDGQGRILGAVEYLHKPIEKEALLNRIGTILTAQKSPLVLIVDDDVGEREHIRTLLHRAGYRTGSATSDEDIQARIAQLEPDLIMVDIQRAYQVTNVDPARTDALLEKLRAAVAQYAIPIVVMTGKEAGDETETILSASLQNVALLTKPFTVDELADAIAARRQA